MHKPASESVQLGRRRMALALPLMAFGLVIPPVFAATDIHQASRTLMGTRLDLTLQGADALILEKATSAALTEMTRLANMMSRYQPASALNAINLMAGIQPVSVPKELMQVLLMARHANLASNGAFDATVGSLRGWNFDVNNPTVPSPAEVQRTLRLVGQCEGLVLDEQTGTAYLKKRGMRLDLGGIAKLPILQAGLQQLQVHGVKNAMINGGGDVIVNGTLNQRPWRIGLRDPRQPEKVLGAVEMTRGFVAASGDYERFFIREGKRLHHILDPKNGYPTHGPHGIALISDSLENINGLGTAIMVAGSQRGQALIASTPAVDAFIVDADQSLWLSPGMRQRLA